MLKLDPDYYHPDFMEDVNATCPYLSLVLYKHTAQAKVVDASFINTVLGQILKELYGVFLSFVKLPEPLDMASLRRQLYEEWKSGQCYTKEGVETFFCPRHIAQSEKNILHLMTADMLICSGREYDSDFYFLCPRWHKKKECWLKWYALTAGETM